MRAVQFAGFIVFSGCVVGDPNAPGPGEEAEEGDTFEAKSLAPVDEFHEPDYVPRSRPQTLELSRDERTLFVALPGDLIQPQSTVLALDATSGDELARVEVGRAPMGMTLSQDGSLLYVANQFSNFLSVVSVGEQREVGKIPVSYYADDLALAADGASLYLTNRWLDAVEVVELSDDGRSGAVTGTIATGANPHDIVVGPEGLLYVGSLAGTCLSIVDPVAGSERERVYLNSPVNGVASDGVHVFLATLGRGDGHPKQGGTSPDRPGATYRGDGTASMSFADVNNDVAVVAMRSGGAAVTHRYTSDTAEVMVGDAKGDYLPEEMIVAGSLPDQLVLVGSRLYVTMAASNTIQVFDVAADGSLSPVSVLDTGIRPKELAVTGDGATVFTADRLGETVSRIDVASNERTTWWVGRSAEPVPANDYEVGEMLFHAATMSAEALPSEVFPAGDKTGDMSCSHCHLGTLTDGKVWSVGIDEVVPLGGQRLAPAVRNLRDTKPLFWEGTQDEFEFDLEGNNFAPPIDFGCDLEETEEDPDHCTSRDQFLRAKTGHSFDEIFRRFMPAFLVGRPRLLPNPLAQDPTSAEAEAIARGSELFFSAETTCSTCHPEIPADRSTPFTSNANLPPVIPGSALDNGVQFKDEVDGNFNVPSLRGVWDRPPALFHDGRAKSLRSAIVGTGHPSLSSSDGCQRLAEGLGPDVTAPVRPILNQKGCNEGEGEAQAHGVTSHLDAGEVADLLLFVRSIE